MNLKLESFAIELPGEKTTFVVARNFRIDRHGCLVFYSWPWKRKAAFQPGTWVRAQRGLGPEDLTNDN